MLRTILMGVILPAVMLASAAAWAGALQVPVVSMPEPASLVLIATAVGVIAFKRFGRRR